MRVVKIYTNAQIVTMNPSQPVANVLVVEGERIVAVGGEDLIETWLNEESEIVDCEGRCMIPGLNDSHLHLLSFGISLNRVPLYEARSIEEVLNITRQFIEGGDYTSEAWIVGRGWNHDYFEGEQRFPTRDDLDQVSTTHPIVLARACGHVIAVNSKALELAGILEHLPMVGGGVIDVDEAGVPTGILRENALSIIYDCIPGYSDEELVDILRQAMRVANSKGITSVHSDDFGNVADEDILRLVRLYEQLSTNHQMTCRVYEQCLLRSKELLKSFIESGYQTGIGNDYFKIGPLKILSDGSLGARTAALRQPYEDDATTSGILCYSETELDELVQLAHEANMQVAIHAIGDLAIERALNSIERALTRHPRPDHRHGIVHCQITDEALLERFATQGVFAYIQPIFLNYDLHIVEDRVGSRLAQTSYAFKMMLDKGIACGFGTDCPVEPLDTMPNLYCAVTRQDLNHYPCGGWNPSERLSVLEGLSLYTRGSSYASFDEYNKGTLCSGQLADFVLLDRHILSAPAEQLKDIQVLKTYVGGELVFDANF